MNTSVTDEFITGDDAAWALNCAFLILTMQTGFAMLETGSVAAKNTTNIMIKNFCDVVIGGAAYWMFGYGLAFGKPSNHFTGLGDFFFYVTQDDNQFGSKYVKYFFQFSFASTATTIVSGAVAERMKLHAYMIFSFFNIFVYSIPACWCWNDTGFLYRLGFFDFAGVCVVHLSGGASALVAASMLGPRRHRFERKELYVMSSPVTALTGMFMLTWAWFGFNCGSTFGVSGSKWKLAALTAVTTLNGAIGGGSIGVILSLVFHKKRVLIEYVLCSLLAGLVSITGVCAVTTPLEALIIGSIGGCIGIGGIHLLEKFQIDDPVSAVPVHFFAGIWGSLVVGIFGKNNEQDSLQGLNGLLHDGNAHLLGANALGMLLVSIWSIVATWICLAATRAIIGIRMTEDEEFLGADYHEHNYATDTKDVLALPETEFAKLVTDQATTNNRKASRGNKALFQRRVDGEQTDTSIDEKFVSNVRTMLIEMSPKMEFKTPGDVTTAIRRLKERE